MTMLAEQMIDPFGRRITYLRVSVTDRCDFRCVYCMAEQMTFLPRKDLLTLEEIDRLVTAFVARGVRKVRLTGGEPLMRKNLMWLIKSLSRHLGGGLDELTLTTNGSQLARYADQLANCGIARINVSLDTLDPAKFKMITRWGDFAQVMDGIDAADRAGLKIKINTVALRDVNEDEFVDLLRFSHGRGYDLTLIETMPMGDTGSDRTAQYAVDLRAPLRASEADHRLNAAIDAGVAAKPKGHDFFIDRGGSPRLSRVMSTTGG
jgi:cyclic pyranopterin phosphate synthase